MRMALKECVRERTGDDLVVIFDPREAISLIDPEGQVEALLEVMSRGPQTIPEIRGALVAAGREVSEAEVGAAVSGLDRLGLVTDGDQCGLGDPVADARHFSNLAFFDGYSSLHRPRAGFMRQLRDAHVLVLGVGGGGSSLLMSLAGLGVGRLTLVDQDDVEPRNFARQFLYRHVDLGRSKVERAAEWVREYDPDIDVRAVDRWISGPDDLADLVEGVDVIAGGLDGERDAPYWVNELAVRAGVPHVSGGVGRSQLLYYSVDPGRSRCRQCDRGGEPVLPDASAAAIQRRRFRERRQINNMIGPLAMQLGSLIAYEALRYLTGFEPPRAAGSFVVLDLRTGLVPEWDPFNQFPDCPVCPLAPSGVDRALAAVA
jgi:molybdopterin/thiamine biosynthesis adenylyltransferase